jgi:hypothetical protein
VIPPKSVDVTVQSEVSLTVLEEEVLLLSLKDAEFSEMPCEICAT